MFVEIRFATLLNAREQGLAVGSMALEKWTPDAASGVHSVTTILLVPLKRAGKCSYQI